MRSFSLNPIEGDRKVLQVLLVIGEITVASYVSLTKLCLLPEVLLATVVVERVYKAIDFSASAFGLFLFNLISRSTNKA